MSESHPSFDRMIIPTPCDADWDAMMGDDRVRFCEHCNLHVTNLSRLTGQDAINLVARSRGRLCVRYIQRADGSILTGQAPARLHHIGRRVSRIAAGAFTATLSFSTGAAQTATEPRAQVVQGVEAVSSVTGEARISGSVTDPLGALVVGATVTLTNNRTGDNFVYTTGEDGTYEFSLLVAGSYTLNAEAHGFAPSRSIELKLPERQTTSPAIVLQIPEIVSEVEIKATEFAVMGAVAIREPELPLVKAAFKNDLVTLAELIPTTVDINESDEFTNTNALAYAIENNNLDMVNVLISAGASVNSSNRDGRAPLMFIGRDTTVELTRLLIASGADVNAHDVSGSTVLMAVAASSGFEVFEELVKAGARIDAKDNHGNTVLMGAAQNEDSRIINFIIKSGVSLDGRNEDGESALSLAARSEKTESIEALIQASATIRLKQSDLDATLILTSRNEDPRSVRILLAAGANPNARDGDDATGLMLAADHGQFEVVKTLIEAGAEINAVDGTGWTALMYTSDVEIVRLLLNAGADMSIKTSDGETALVKALRYERAEIVKLLKSRGAPE